MFSFTVSQTLTLLTLTAHLINGAPTATTLEACTEISKALPNKNFLPSTKEFKKENKDYYHAGLAELTPACIAFPSSAQDVRTIINILNVHKDVQFAVKSGGHSPNPGQASIKDGVLIALRNLAGTTLSKETGLAEVKPGGHWWDVMKALDGTGRMVVGGRLGVVGLGGYLAQGGVSFLSGQYGLAGDNVVEYETVLANGSIVNFGQDRHPEIVRAMRGAGSQFGIVTKFTLKTYPIGKFYAGVRMYNCTRLQFNDATQDFISNIVNFPKVATLMPLGDPTSAVPSSGASPKSSGGMLSSLSSLGSSLGGLFGTSRVVASTMSPQDQIQAASRAFYGYSHYDEETTELLERIKAENAANTDETKVSLHAMPVLYDGETLPAGAWGAKFNAMPVWKEISTVTDYKNLVSATDAVWPYWTMRTSFRTITLPVQPSNPQFLGDIEDIFKDVSATYSKQLKGYGGLQLVLQPFPKAFGIASQARGGNAMSLAASDHDRFVLEIPGVYTNKADDGTMQAWGKAFTDQLHKHLKRTIEVARTKGESVGEYNPYFMNDAGTDQDVMGTYKNAGAFAKLQKELDPEGLFGKRAGGYKFAAL